MRVGVGAAVVVVLLALGVTVVIGMVRSGGSTDVMDAAASTSPSAAPFGQVYVHVAGAVATPGMYRLASGARLADAIAAAGGFTADADRAAVNLARTVSDGEQLVVPVVGTSPQGGHSAGGRRRAREPEHGGCRGARHPSRCRAGHRGAHPRVARGARPIRQRR